MLCYLATAALAIGALLAGSEQPQWESSYGKALEASRAADAPLLVVLDKPTSKDARLSPELLDAKKSEGSENADSALLKPYRLCHVDVSTAYGKKVAKAFHATTFPQVSIIDKTGKTVIFTKTGDIKPTEWKQILTRHKSGDRRLARAVARATYKPITGSGNARPYCPNCQRNSF